MLNLGKSSYRLRGPPRSQFDLYRVALQRDGNKLNGAEGICLRKSFAHITLHLLKMAYTAEHFGTHLVSSIGTIVRTLYLASLPLGQCLVHRLFIRTLECTCQHTYVPLQWAWTMASNSCVTLSMLSWLPLAVLSALSGSHY